MPQHFSGIFRGTVSHDAEIKTSTESFVVAKNSDSICIFTDVSFFTSVTFGTKDPAIAEEKKDDKKNVNDIKVDKMIENPSRSTSGSETPEKTFDSTIDIDGKTQNQNHESTKTFDFFDEKVVLVFSVLFKLLFNCFNCTTATVISTTTIVSRYLSFR